MSERVILWIVSAAVIAAGAWAYPKLLMGWTP
jgi:hypothetical protein